MKIVAQGNADATQLKTFQKHIDELNAVIKARSKLARGQQAGRSWPAQSNSQGAHADGSSKRPLQPSSSVQPPIKQEPNAERPLQQIPFARPRMPASSKPGLTAVAFDINGGNGDRYLLPKYATVKYSAGNTQVRLTFLATRYGRDAAKTTKFVPDVEYYQSMEVQLTSPQPRMLEPIGRAVESMEEVQRHNTEIMARARPADRVYLATRLPRPPEEIEKAAEERNGDETTRDIPVDSYTAPHSLLPMPRPARAVAV